MKRLLLAGLAFSALITPAMAADMPIKAPPPPPTWTGLYCRMDRLVAIQHHQYRDRHRQWGVRYSPGPWRDTRHNRRKPQWVLRRRPDRLQLAG